MGRPKSATRRFWSDFPPTPVSGDYPRIIQGLSNTPNFAHLGPWERTIIKEIDLKQLKHRIRHASGRWPGEFIFHSFLLPSYYSPNRLGLWGPSGFKVSILCGAFRPSPLVGSRCGPPWVPAVGPRCGPPVGSLWAPCGLPLLSLRCLLCLLSLAFLCFACFACLACFACFACSALFGQVH